MVLLRDGPRKPFSRSYSRRGLPASPLPLPASARAKREGTAAAPPQRKSYGKEKGRHAGLSETETAPTLEYCEGCVAGETVNQ